MVLKAKNNSFVAEKIMRIGMHLKLLFKPMLILPPPLGASYTFIYFQKCKVVWATPMAAIIGLKENAMKKRTRTFLFSSLWKL